MLRVTIDYIPFGEESRRETIEQCTIVNDGTGDEQFGNYDVTFSGESGKSTVKVRRHKRSAGPWVLLLSALSLYAMGAKE